MSNDFITFKTKYNIDEKEYTNFSIPLNNLEKHKYIIINLAYSFGLGNDDDEENRKIIYQYIYKYLYHNYSLNPPYIIKDVDIYINDKLCFTI